MKLRPYQEIGRDFLAARTRALLADEMRVGKTPQAILAADKVNARRVLVATKAIAVDQWCGEWMRWAGMIARPLEGRGAIPPGVVVASWNMATQRMEELKRHEWDAFIPDECHLAKNPAAARTVMVYGKKGLGWHAARIWSLSGTPAPKHAGELWPMLAAFGVTRQTYDDFLREYCWFKADRTTVGGTKESRIPELREMLAKIMLRRTRKEVAPEMPAIGFDFLRVQGKPMGEMPAPPDLDDEALLQWIEDNAAHQAEFRIWTAMAKMLPLQEEITDAIRSGQLAQTVVFGVHVEPLVTLAARMNAAGFPWAVLNGQTPQKQRVQIMRDFQAGHLRGVSANIETAGAAIDLSRASHGYFLELDWVPGNNAQAANRMVSMMKHEPVTLDVCTWAGSFDDRVQGVLMRRTRELSQLL